MDCISRAREDPGEQSPAEASGMGGQRQSAPLPLARLQLRVGAGGVPRAADGAEYSPDRSGPATATVA